MACSDPRIASDARPAGAREHVAARHRWRLAEALPWLLALGALLAFPDYLFLGTQVLILILFALSLDLILGYAGIVTLGHAAYFGLGAYVAGMLSAHLGWHEPLSGLLLAAMSAAAFGWLSGLLLLRYDGLALLMLTLAVGIMMMELANVLEAWTGGFDGLYGITPAPLLGRFEERPVRAQLLRLQPERAVPRVSCVSAPRPFPLRPRAPGRARQRAPHARDRLRRAARQGRPRSPSPPGSPAWPAACSPSPTPSSPSTC